MLNPHSTSPPSERLWVKLRLLEARKATALVSSCPAHAHAVVGNPHLVTKPSDATGRWHPETARHRAITQLGHRTFLRQRTLSRCELASR